MAANNCDTVVDEDCGGEPGDLTFCDGSNTGDTFNDGSSMGGPGLLLAMGFTPEGNLDVGRVEVVSIWTDSRGPSVELASGSWEMSSTNGWQGADLDECTTLTAGTPYWVVWAPINGAQSTWDTSGTSVSYMPSLDGGLTWGGPYSGNLKFKLSCCE